VTIEEIRSHLEIAPFAPFNIVTAAGKSHLVPHPDFLTFSPTGRSCNVYAGDGEFFTTLDLLTITAIKPAKLRPGPKHL
jgi:hypothetical protein